MMTSMVAALTTVTLKKTRAQKLERLAKRAGVSVDEYVDRALKLHVDEAEGILAAVEEGRKAVREGRHRTLAAAEAELRRRRKSRAR